jgi:hypothetical protein
MPRFDFDATLHTPSNARSLDPLPPGRYLAEIVASEMRSNRSGRGSHLELEFAIADGEHDGRRLWTRLNVDHPNDTAVRIAKQDLASICRAVGIDRLTDTEELHGKTLVVVLRATRRNDTGEQTTEIRGYAPPGRSAPGSSTTTPAPQSATAGKERPWERI